MTRKVLAIGGADRHDFLQNLVTNDVTRLADGPVYAALLTPQGKYLADFLMVRDGDRILMDVDGARAALLAQRLAMYKLRADVTVEQTDLQVHQGAGDPPEDGFADPRDPALGWRAYRDAPATPYAGWTAARIAAGAPEGADFDADGYVLEMGFERLGGVDFKKGCYVGQEVTARMKHKTELRKGLARVALDGAADQGADITASGKPAGTLLSRAGDTALAYLRFDRVSDDMTAGQARITQVERLP